MNNINNRKTQKLAAASLMYGFGDTCCDSNLRPSRGRDRPERPDVSADAGIECVAQVDKILPVLESLSVAIVTPNTRATRTSTI
jgi:hypothetical protein